MNQLSNPDLLAAGRPVSRRHFLGLLGKVGLGWLLSSGCVPSSRSRRGDVERVMHPELSAEYTQWIELGNRFREQLAGPELKAALSQPRFIADLPLNNDPAVMRLRAVTEPAPQAGQQTRRLMWTKRCAMAVGLLSVERAERYGGQYSNSCNVYVVDFVRVCVPPWRTVEGRLDHPIAYVLARVGPSSLVPSQLNREEALRYIYGNKQNSGVYQYWHSNMADEWMSSAPAKVRGWQLVGTVEEMLSCLAGGKLVMGVTKRELIADGTIRIGHAFVLLPGQDQAGYLRPVLTQSTANIGARILDVKRPRNDSGNDYDFDKCHPDKQGNYRFYAMGPHLE